MTALPAGHPSLAKDLSNALVSLFVEHSAREVGRWLGIKGDTAAARGRAIDSWPLPDLMTIALHFGPVRDALRAYVVGQQQLIQGQSTSAVSDLLRDVSASGAFVAAATRALADLDVSSTEASELLSHIGQRRSDEDAHLIPALTACIKGN